MVTNNRLALQNLCIKYMKIIIIIITVFTIFVPQ